MSADTKDLSSNKFQIRNGMKSDQLFLSGLLPVSPDTVDHALATTPRPFSPPSDGL